MCFLLRNAKYLIPKTSEQQEGNEKHNWRSVVISGLERKIDLKAIEPYKKVKLLPLGYTSSYLNV